MFLRFSAAAALGLALFTSSTPAQDVGNENLPNATRMPRIEEAPLTNLTRRDANTIAFALPPNPGAGTASPAELLIHHFAFNGDPVTTDKVHLRQIAPGVVEITSVA